MADRTQWLLGFHPVLAALEAGRPVEVVWLARGRGDSRSRRIVEAAGRVGVPVSRVPRTKLDGIAAGVAHNGVAARAAPVELAGLRDLVAPQGAPGRLVLLDDVHDPRNCGAVLRTAAALGVGGVILAGPHAPPLGGALAKAAAGALDVVPVTRCNVAADALAVLQAEGYWSFGADANGAPVDGVSRVDRWVLCLGAEAKGLRAKTRTRIDELLGIPLETGVDSLNLSVAAGILLYALLRPAAD